MKIEIFTKADCSYCEKTKQLLNSYQLPYTEIKIGVDMSRDEVLENFPTARVAPIVVVDGWFIPTETLEFVIKMNQSKEKDLK